MTFSLTTLPQRPDLCKAQLIFFLLTDFPTSADDLCSYSRVTLAAILAAFLVNPLSTSNVKVDSHEYVSIDTPYVINKSTIKFKTVLKSPAKFAKTPNRESPSKDKNVVIFVNNLNR